MLWWMFQNTLVIGMLAAIVAVACRFGRFRPAVQHALWLVVLLKFLAPPIICWPWSLSDLCGEFAQPRTTSLAWLLHQPRESPIADALPRKVVHDPGWANGLPPAPGDIARTAASSRIADESWLASEMPGTMDASLLERAASLPETQNTPRHADNRGQSPSWLTSALARLTRREAAIGDRSRLDGSLAVWSSAAIIACWQVVRLIKSHQKLRHARVPPQWLARHVRRMAARLGVHEPQTLVVAGIASPIVWCLGRAKLLWPAALVADHTYPKRKF